VRLVAAVRSWIIWGAILAFVVAVFVTVRASTDVAQIVLTLLLVVIGGSVAGGRPLGFALALLSTELIDYYFQRPFEVLTLPKPLDFVVLLAFCATAFVTTDLLSRARQEAAAADARTREVETLSRLGADTLRFASSEDALSALTALVCRVLEADACRVARKDWRTLDARGTSPFGNEPSAVTEVADLASSTGGMAILSGDGAIIQMSVSEFTSAEQALAPARIVALPLYAGETGIGVLVVRKDALLVLDAAQRQLLAAMSYYAAIGIERQRLISEAAYSEALRESQRAKDEVFAVVSHDLRTPLSTIKVLAQTGAKDGDATSIAIVEQADRLARLVSDLLTVSRFRAGDIPLHMELNTAEDLIGAVLRQAEGVRDGRTIDVHIDYESPALVGNFDFVHTLRIVGNLLDNALRHTPPGGTIDIRADRDANHLVLTVADRGPGVADVERSRIFEAFYRPADATRDGGQAGLGLSIARSLAERQGGTVEYEPREGGGSLFILRLPAADVSDLAVSELT
jgi:two-component system, OmpR family, sensor histidine kinase KdpD